ncbi:MAG: ankyrin repeat domain-containing protein [Truepera sp.]|nr:ankyrin repeat domain-containing protein [Truepera sp.]
MTLRLRHLRYLVAVWGLLVIAGQGFAQGCEGWNTSLFFQSATLAEVVGCLEAGVNVNARNPGGFTPLHIAARYADDATLIWVLVDAGADVNAQAESGATPLHAAVLFNCNTDVIEALVAAGASFQDLNAADSWLALAGAGCER